MGPGLLLGGKERPERDGCVGCGCICARECDGMTAGGRYVYRAQKVGIILVPARVAMSRNKTMVGVLLLL